MLSMPNRRLESREGIGMEIPLYHELHVRDGERIVAWVFVAPQDLPGADIGVGRQDQPDGGTTLYGDVFCGNAEDGAYLIPVEVDVGKGPDGPFLLGEERYDLSAGRCFVVRPGHIVEQLPHSSDVEARAQLHTGG
jgi:hypothetical protein